MNKRFQLRVGGIVNDSIVDGPGLRLTVFTQGCPHGCPGCHNPKTHDLNGGYTTYLGEILAQVDGNPLLDGVTYSGGEPLLQYEALTALSEELKKRGMNIMVYTGYTWEEIIQRYDGYKNFLKDIDILVDGRFEQGLKSYDLRYKGSANQRVIDVQASLERGEIVELYNED